LKLRILLLILVLFLSACVGTIKDKSKKASRSVAATAEVSFDGVYDGGTIGHDKIWVRFKPASGGSGQFNYHAFLNSSSTEQASLNMNAAIYDDEGFIVMTIPNLNLFTPYMVNVRVYDAQYSLYDSNTKFITVWTADDYLPKFDGVMAVENVSGIAAMTSLKIRWNAATVDPSAPFDASYSVAGYNIYYSTSEEELWAILRESNAHSVDSSLYPNSGYKSISDASAREGTITGLTPGAKYYVAVRARDSSTTPRYERNIIIRSLETYTHQPIEFAGLTSASTPVTQAGFSQVNLAWNACVACGVYKVYAKPTIEDTGSIHPGTDTAYLIGTVSNLALTSTTLGGLTKNTSYKVYMLACHDMTCGWDGVELDERDVKGRSSSISVTTTPPVAPFITEPDTPLQPDGEIGLTSLDINFQLDKTLGYYSKVRVYQIIDKNGDTTNFQGSNFRLLSRAVDANLPYIDPTINTVPLDYANSPSSARITNLTMGQEYCFQVLPVIEYPDLTNSGEVITLATDRRPPVVCGTPEYVPPEFGTSSFFPTCSNITATSVTLTWTHPEVKNVMTHYEIYSKRSSDAFIFDGVDGAWNNHDAGDIYKLEQMALETTNTLTITGLIPNMTYGFGINTYYKPGPLDEPIRRFPSTAAATVYCTTSLPDVTHGGWLDVQSLGPKIDGLRYSELLASGATAETARNSSLVAEFLLPDRNIPYEFGKRSEIESNMSIGHDTIPGTGSTTGIIRLKWKDFEIQGTGARLSDYYENGVTGLGYKVYRIAKDAIPPTDLPPNASNITQADNGSWGLATPLRFISKEHTINNGSQFLTGTHKVSYTSTAINLDVNNSFLLDAGNGYQEGNSKVFELVDYPPANGKTYYYLITGVFGGVESDFFQPRLRENVIRVISPPDNMALVHRWIANQEICGKMQRGGNGQNCQNGLANDLCCDPDLADGVCSDPENHYRCQFNGFSSVVDEDGDGNPDAYDPANPDALYHPSFTRYYDLGRDVVVDRFQLGCNFSRAACDGGKDCIGTAYPQFSSTPDDPDKLITYYIGGNTMRCYLVRTNNIVNFGVDSVSNTTWENLIETNSEEIFTNNAYLPPASLRGIVSNDFSLAPAYHACKGQTATLDGSDYSKTMMNKKEASAMSAWPASLLASHVLEINDSNYSMSYQLCHTANPVVVPTDPLYDHLDKNYYLGTSGGNSNRLRTGSNGGTSDNSSTALCVSRYGIQDHLGMGQHASSSFSTIERLQCPFAEDLGYTENPTWLGRCTSQLSTIPAVDEEAQNTVLRNGDGSYLTLGREGTPSHGEYLSATVTWYNISIPYFPYVSFPIGMPLSCSGAYCQNGTDDNTLTSFATNSVTTNAPIHYSSSGSLGSIQLIAPYTMPAYSVVHGGTIGGYHRFSYGARQEARMNRCEFKVDY